MKYLQSFKNILIGLYLSIRRFPLTIAFSTATAIILVVISEVKPQEDNLAKVAMILALGIPLSLCIKLCYEKLKIENILKIMIGYILGGIILIMYHSFLLKDFKMVEITRYTAVSLALYLAFIYIPHFIKKSFFETYVITIFSNFFITLIYSIVLYLGLSAILFALDKLLGITIQSKVYYYTWLFVALIFAVSYFLAGVPLMDEELSSKPYPKLLKILLLYIVMPLLSAYTIILYIYFAKIIITMQWPINIVTHLVLWYSVISAIVLFFISPIENTWANKFLSFFPKIILPILIMMFISIAKRVNAYGITENRYYVIVLALWVFIVMIYYSFRKNIKTIFLPISLSLVALISVFGPLSSYSISKMSQNNRLEHILKKNNMLKDNKIQASADISREDKIQISSILDYFNKNHSFKGTFTYIPENFKIDDMNTVFGFSYENPNFENQYQYFYFSNKQFEKGINIQDYDYFFDARMMFESRTSSDKPIDVSYSQDSSNIKISYKGSKVYSKNLNDFISNLVNKYGASPNENNLNQEEMTLIDENENIKIKILFTHISGSKNYSRQIINSKSVDFYLLVKIK